MLFSALRKWGERDSGEERSCQRHFAPSQYSGTGWELIMYVPSIAFQHSWVESPLSLPIIFCCLISSVGFPVFLDFCTVIGAFATSYRLIHSKQSVSWINQSLWSSFSRLISTESNTMYYGRGCVHYVVHKTMLFYDIKILSFPRRGVFIRIARMLIINLWNEWIVGCSFKLDEAIVRAKRGWA